MSGNSYVDVTVDFIFCSDYALKVKTADDEEVWIPLSTIRFNDNDHVNKIMFDDFEMGDSIDLEIQEWFAKKEGLI